MTDLVARLRARTRCEYTQTVQGSEVHTHTEVVPDEDCVEAAARIAVLEKALGEARKTFQYIGGAASWDEIKKIDAALTPTNTGQRE